MRSGPSRASAAGPGIGGLPDRHRRRRSESVFLLGTGFVARHLCPALVKQGWHVAGTCTSAPKLEQLRSLGVDARLFDAAAAAAASSRPRGLQPLRRATHLLVSTPPLGDPVLARSSIII